MTELLYIAHFLAGVHPGFSIWCKTEYGPIVENGWTLCHLFNEAEYPFWVKSMVTKYAKHEIRDSAGNVLIRNY
jgi:hypothetical protein